jgi:IS605 OrfB family transposase
MVLSALGDHLGHLASADLARAQAGASAGERKRVLTADSSSRYAGAIVRSNEARLRSAQSSLDRQIASDRKAMAAITRRLSVPIGETLTALDGSRTSGYRSQIERHGKQVRLAHLGSELSHLSALPHPVVVRGGQGLWRQRQNLTAAKVSLPTWQGRWREGRSFRSALGSADELSGNLTMRVNEQGIANLLLPVALRHLSNSRDRKHYRLDAKSTFTHRGPQWRARLVSSQAITYAIRHDLDKDRWYLSASWSIRRAWASLIKGRVLGLDLNADHVACWVLDASGNPLAAPNQIAFALSGSSNQRDGQLRAVISDILRLAKEQSCTTIAIEDLGWGKETGREAVGPKWFRHLVSGFPTTVFRERLAAMAARAGVTLIAVDPAYTSKWAKPWLKPTSTRFHATTGHEAAAIVIGRRSLGYPARRRGVTDLVQSDQGQRATRPSGLPGTQAIIGAILPVRRSVFALPASGP